MEDFYFLSRATLVKDERHLDRFDRVSAFCSKGLEGVADPSGTGGTEADVPAEWLRRVAEKPSIKEEQAQVEAAGGFDKLMDRPR